MLWSALLRLLTDLLVGNVTGILRRYGSERPGRNCKLHTAVSCTKEPQDEKIHKGLWRICREQCVCSVAACSVDKVHTPAVLDMAMLLSLKVVCKHLVTIDVLRHTRLEQQRSTLIYQSLCRSRRELFVNL